MTSKQALLESVKTFAAARNDLHSVVKSDAAFMSSGAKLYPFDIMASNIPMIFELCDTSGYDDFLRDNNIRSVIDLGGADGDLAFTFALAGCRTTYVDLSNAYEAGPLAAKIINSRLKANVRVVDFNLDRHFDHEDLVAHTINGGEFEHSDHGQYDLVICLGLFYHIKNSYAFLESIRKFCRFCILGTTLMSYLPGNQVQVRDASVAYLLGPTELGNDASNYWIYTHASLHKLVTRLGFSVLSGKTDFERQDRISNPNELGYREREFLLLRSEA